MMRLGGVIPSAVVVCCCCLLDAGGGRGGGGVQAFVSLSSSPPVARGRTMNNNAAPKGLISGMFVWMTCIYERRMKAIPTCSMKRVLLLHNSSSALYV